MNAPEIDPTRIEVHESADALATAIAGELLTRLADAQSSGHEPQIALTGGTIADAVHRELARLSAGSEVDWGRVVLWWGDERFVEPASDDRNERQAREALLDQVDIDPAKVHPMPSTESAADVDEGAAAYGEELRSYGAGEFDIVMLGIGPDGHIASLFPHHPAQRITDAIAVAVHDSPKPPPDRVSLTFECFERSHAVWFLVSGADKAEAVAAALAPGADRWGLPAAGVRGTDATLWLVDADAASGLG